MATGTIERAKVAGFVDPHHNRANKRRIEEDEKELEALMKGEKAEEEADDGQEPEDEAEEPESESGQAEAEESQEAEAEEPLSAEEKTYKKRYGDLRRHMNDLTTKLKELEAQVNNPEAKPPKSKADVEAWIKKYPDVAAIVEAIAEEKAAERFQEADQRLRQIDELNAEATRKKAEATILKVHDDFYELRESDAFHKWAENKSKWVQDALYENEDDPQGVIDVINLYKKEKGLDKKAVKQREKEAATGVMTKKTRSTPDGDGVASKIYESEVQKMSTKEFEARSEEIEKAMRSGNFVYDISGAAR